MLEAVAPLGAVLLVLVVIMGFFAGLQHAGGTNALIIVLILLLALVFLWPFAVLFATCVSLWGLSEAVRARRGWRS